MTLRFGWRSATCLCLLVGALARFAWIGDVEYKDDEDQVFQYTQAIHATDLWPALGQTSGLRELRHPALGVWSFAALARLLRLHTPLAVTLSVSALSLIAVALLFWFAWRVVPVSQRDVWLWTAALASINLVAIVNGRKMWIPSLLPPFSVVLLIAWSYRHTTAGALMWGIVGALIGQIHMTGFFYAAAVLIGTALFARKSARWRAWLAGSAWGVIPAFAWLSYVWVRRSDLLDHASTFPRVLSGFDFFRMAFDISLSQTAEFNIGSYFHEYLAYPVLLGVSTQGVHGARFCLYAIGILALVVASVATLRKLGDSAARRSLTDSHLCLFNAALAGILMSASGVPNSPHHHLMVFPLAYLWIPMAVIAYLPRPRIWLAAVWMGSAVCTLAFLQFIHQHCGAPNADYGVAYRCQDRTVARTPSAGASGGWSPALMALIRPGQEEVIARMLGRGELLAGSCRMVEGAIDRTVARGTYSCGHDRVTVQLVHRSKAPDDALLAADFAVVLVEGAPPAGFVDAIAAHVRTAAPRFEWLLEAGPTPAVGEAAETGPDGRYRPVLTSRLIVVRMLGGAVILLLSWPWWGGGVTRTRAAGMQ